MQLTLLQHFVVENRILGLNNAMYEVFAIFFFSFTGYNLEYKNADKVGSIITKYV